MNSEFVLPIHTRRRRVCIENNKGIYMDLYEFDAQYDVSLLCGVDEAGRGPLAGAVYAAAVILNSDNLIDEINDSKKLTEKKRNILYEKIIQNSHAFSIASASVEEINEINILQATFLAMKRAVQGLKLTPELVLIDGDKNPDIGFKSISVIKGDMKSASIAAASILAKVSRDNYMLEMDEKYPEYGFAKHKGYGTKAHKQALQEHGPCTIHRNKFIRNINFNANKNNYKRTSGNLGEEAAARLLVSKEYIILERNFRSVCGEIDIIAENGGELVFVEVKLRTDESYGHPVEAVNECKQKKIVYTAADYIQKTNNQKQPRFDVIEVYKHKEKYYLKHYKNAFTADGMDVFV